MVVLPAACVPLDCGREFRRSLNKPSPNYAKRDQVRIRLVPAFTIMALQKNTMVIPPVKFNVLEPQESKTHIFKRCYQRQEIPVTIEYTNMGRILNWKVPVEKLDYHHYLPIFIEGLAETKYPFTFVSLQGVNEMVQKAGYKVLPVVPQIIIPLKNALSTKQPTILCNVLRALKMLVTHCDRVGVALVPYYRQLLPVLNLFKDRNNNLGAGIDHTTNLGQNVGDLIEETLQTLERYGGPDAFINIKYMVPTYESCVLN